MLLPMNPPMRIETNALPETIVSSRSYEANDRCRAVLLPYGLGMELNQNEVKFIVLSYFSPGRAVSYGK